jgi:DnaJ-class molecular chaperone
MTWYPGETKKPVKVKKSYDSCPICNGSGKRIDKKTNLTRYCVGCKGTGII